MVMNVLADRLAGEDKGTAVLTGTTMAMQGVNQIGGVMAGGTDVSQTVAANPDMQPVIGPNR